MAAALFFAAGAATAQDVGHGLLWDDDPNDKADFNGSQRLPRGNVQVGPIHIRTSRAACLPTVGFPVVRALLEPSDAVSTVTLNFRPEAYALWYQVPMTRSGEGFVGVLPKVRLRAQQVRYFVQVTPTNGPPLRGREQVVKVAEDRAQCGGAPAETVEAATIAVRVPNGAPLEPPVPPGFEPVATTRLEDARPSSAKRTLLVAGAVVGGGLAAAFSQANPTGLPATPPLPRDEFVFVDSIPPPSGHISLSADPRLMVQMRLRLAKGVVSGRLHMTLTRSFAPNAPCGVIETPLNLFPANETQTVFVGGPLLQALQPCRSERLHIEIEDGGVPVAATNLTDPRDFLAGYVIDP